MPGDPPVRIIYIGGFGRSGSTLLDGVLGGVPGLVGVGELRLFWRRGILRNELCECGVPVRDCPFWGEVARGAVGGFDEDTAEDQEELASRVDRVLRLPEVLGPASSPGFSSDLRRYLDRVTALYRAILDVSGDEIVVDSSKIPSTPYLLDEAEGIELTTVHLVRDSRAVAHSWQRRKRRRGVHWTESYMPQASPGKVAREWLIHNAALEPRAWRGAPHVRLRYEDLARDPRSAVERVLDAAGVDAEPPLADDVAQIPEGHACAGNPSRFRSGEVEIHLDDAWTEEVDARTWFTVTGLTGPMLKAYGYPLATGAPSR